MINQKSINVKNCANNRKEKLIKIFDSKCCLCGFSKYVTALEFHHVNPEDKIFTLTGNGLMRNMETQLVEVKKCILVCANCHRGIHYHNIPIPLDWEKLYNEDVANNLLEEYYDKKTKHYTYCIDCGKIIDHSATRCEECFHKAQRVVERPDRETLKEMVRNLPFTQIGKNFNVSDNAIRKWCKSENLPYKKNKINAFSDEEWSKI